MAIERDDAFNSTGTGGLSQETDFETGSMGTPDPTGFGTDSGQPVTARAREAVSSAGHKAAERVQERLADQVSRATGQLESVASSLRTAGHQMPDEGIGRYMVQAATQVDNLASFLNNREVSDLVDEVEGFARRQPAVFIGGAFALGVLGARFLRSSRQKMGMDYDRGPRQNFFEGSYDDEQRISAPSPSTSYGRRTDESRTGYESGYDGSTSRFGSGGSTRDYGAGTSDTSRGYTAAGSEGSVTSRDLASDLPTGLQGSSTGGFSQSGMTGSGSRPSGGSTVGGGRDAGTGRPDGFAAGSGSGSDRDPIDSDFDDRSPDFL